MLTGPDRTVSDYIRTEAPLGVSHQAAAHGGLKFLSDFGGLMSEVDPIRSVQKQAIQSRPMIFSAMQLFVLEDVLDEH